MGGSHKEVCPMHGRGEHPSKLGGSPAGDRRSPLRINKFDPQKTNNKPRQIKKSVGVNSFCLTNWDWSNDFVLSICLKFCE